MTNHHHQQFPDHCKLEETRSSLTSSILTQVHIKTLQFKLTASQSDIFIMSCCAYFYVCFPLLSINTGLSLKNRYCFTSDSNLLFVVFTNTHNWQYWHCCQFCIPYNLQFSSLFSLHDASKCSIRYQSVQEDSIWRLWN